MNEKVLNALQKVASGLRKVAYTTVVDKTQINNDRYFRRQAQKDAQDRRNYERREARRKEEARLRGIEYRPRMGVPGAPDMRPAPTAPTAPMPTNPQQ